MKRMNLRLLSCLLALLSLTYAAWALDGRTAAAVTASASAAQRYGSSHQHRAASSRKHSSKAYLEGQQQQPHSSKHQHRSNVQHFKKSESNTFYLQESLRTDKGVVIDHKFRCGQEADATACQSTAHHSKSSGDTATCTSKLLMSMECPTLVSTDADCLVIQLNCTIDAAAAACGCPHSAGFSFSSTGHVFDVQRVSSCEPIYFPPAAGGRHGQKSGSHGASHKHSHNATALLSGTARTITTTFDSITTEQGSKAVKGKVEFVVNFFSDDADADADADDDSGDSNTEGRKTHKQRHGAKSGRGFGYVETANDGGDSQSVPQPETSLVKGGNLKITLLEKQSY